MTVIGKVEYLADIDGRRLPRQARKIGTAAGKELGESMGKAQDSEFNKALTDYGRKWTSAYRKQGKYLGLSFDSAIKSVVRTSLNDMVSDMAEVFGKKGGIEEFTKRIGGAEEAVQQLRDNLAKMNQTGALTDERFESLTKQVNKYEIGVTKLRTQTSEANAEQGKMNAELFRLGQTLDVLADDKLAKVNAAQMENLRFNVRLNEEFERTRDTVLAQIEAQKEQEASLRKVSTSSDEATRSSDRLNQSLMKQNSSWKSLPHGLRQAIFYTGLFAAMAEEIAILGSAAGSGLTILAGAAGAAGVGIGTAIAAFQDLTGEISELPAAIQPAAIAFQSIGDAFGRMQDAIQLEALDGAVGAFDSLRGTVDALIPAFEVVAESVGRFINEFARSIAPGTQGFQNLVDLIAGAAPIFETLSSAFLTFGQALGNVFVAALPFVQIFANWIQRLAGEFLAWTNSIEGQTALQEWFENSVTIFSAIEPLIGAVAQALNDLVTPETIADFVEFLDTMTQFIPILGQVLGVIGELNLFNVFAEILLAIGFALEPVIPMLSQTAEILSVGLMNAIMLLTPGLMALVAAIAPILPVLAQLAADLLVAVIPAVLALVPVVTQLLDAIIPLLPSFAELAVILVTHVVTAVIALLPTLVPLIQLLADIAGVVAPLMPAFIDLVKLALAPTMVMVQLLAPILTGLIQIIIALATPVLQATAAFLKSKEGMALVKTATDVLSTAMRIMSGVLQQVGPVVATLGGIFDGIASSIGGFIGMVQDAIGAIGDFLGAVPGFLQSIPAPGGDFLGGLLPFASGGLVVGPTRALVGEAGPELIVPLNRPLSQVDPAARTVAAFAQGKMGAMGGSGKTVNINEGAITVNTISPDGRLVAESVVDRIAVDAADI